MVVAVSIDIRNAVRMRLFSIASSSAVDAPPAVPHDRFPDASVFRTWFAEPRDVGYVNVAPPDVSLSAEDDCSPADVSVSVPVPTWRLPLT
mgnify:CR=1 FL=1